MIDFSKYLEKDAKRYHCDVESDSDSEDQDQGSLFDRPPALIDYPIPPPPSFTWTEDQVQAIDQVVAWRLNPSSPRFFKLTGAAGTGKTTVMGEIRRRLFGTRTAWTGMTGKAALRLRESIGARASTAHTALYHAPREVDNPQEAKIDLEFDRVRRDEFEGALLVIDESSMIGPKFKADLERSSYSKILVVGDSYQLSPVLSRAEEQEIGSEDYSVFKGIEGPHLTKVMRNAGAVLAAATVVREQQRDPNRVSGAWRKQVRLRGLRDARLRDRQRGRVLAGGPRRGWACAVNLEKRRPMRCQQHDPLSTWLHVRLAGRGRALGRAEELPPEKADERGRGEVRGGRRRGARDSRDPNQVVPRAGGDLGCRGEDPCPCGRLLGCATLRRARDLEAGAARGEEAAEDRRSDPVDVRLRAHGAFGTREPVQTGDRDDPWGLSKPAFQQANLAA